MDYHKSMKRYYEAKTILFKKLLKRKSTVITSSDFVKLKNLKKICKAKDLKMMTEKKNLN